ncbi:MAG: DUF4846 domain-containing protein [Candidatus Poribacteria bacterium]|nr:DUF4846 domain-containing protein [Candidatus Poribacteria bacterium]
MFIQGGFPGHAVIVIDVAVNTITGERLALLAQSYMPAQDPHVLVNSYDRSRSPWYRIDDSASLYTPEWTFSPNTRRRF